MRAGIGRHTAVWAGAVLALLMQAGLAANSSERIDRRAWVGRHAVRVSAADRLGAVSVGNGRFAFTADVTGVQTFNAWYAEGIPLTTMAEWGWHSFPNTEGYELSDTFVKVDTYGRAVPYNIDQRCEAAGYLRANPHQTSLGRIGFAIMLKDGQRAAVEDIEAIDQTLDLWRGVLTSRFRVEGEPVEVETVCHPQRDLVAVRVRSGLLAEGRLKVEIAFPYATGAWGKDPAEWGQPERHSTRVVRQRDGLAVLARRMDAMEYGAAVRHTGRFQEAGTHRYVVTALPGEDELEAAVLFSEGAEVDAGQACGFAEAHAAAERFWERYWSQGAAIDLSSSADPRWRELERRIVLSRYLTAIQSRQQYPPQETGLTCTSWHGKFHLEMTWWHQVQFALWGETAPLEATMRWCEAILPEARAIARRQGYAGVRWPKMVGPDGQDAPSGVGPLLIWQQPHPIYYAELLYRARPERATLEAYRGLVHETAAFMADFAHWNEAMRRFDLGPPVIPAQENYKYDTTKNPTYELCYWRWGLETAQRWRQRLGLDRVEAWDAVIDGLASPNVRDGVYTGIATEPYTKVQDHPSMLAALGVLPETALVDRETMRRTARWVWDNWEWPRTWGWDYPMLAMTAARVGEPELAIDALLLDVTKNTYLANGHNYQSSRLPLYLPGNGGLLTAVAMMAAGWDGAPDREAPGFPAERWTVRWEGLEPMP